MNYSPEKLFLHQVPRPRLILTTTGMLEEQSCFLFGTCLVLSLYNEGIHGGKARAGLQRPSEDLTMGSLSSPAPQGMKTLE